MGKWIEAMRLRTLPVSIAGVIAGSACAIYHQSFKPLPALICLIFAVAAQISSNFANEYYDFKNGIDKKGRKGFRRGVTEGDIKPQAMKGATYLTLALTALVGLSLIIWGGWWLIFIGVLIALFVLAYSTGPYPLSHHGLGEIAVFIFFGLVPVIFTNYVQTGVLEIGTTTLFIGISIGLMAVNVLIVNNYRDIEDDRNVGKRTSAVIFGRKAIVTGYFLNGSFAAILLAMATSALPFWVSAGWLTYFLIHTILWTKIKVSEGQSLNNLLKDTSILLLFVSIYLIVIFSCLKPV